MEQSDCFYNDSGFGGWVTQCRTSRTKADAADRIGNYMSWDDDQTTKDIKIPVNPQTFRDLSGTEIIEEMGIGWILGNTFDSHTTRLRVKQRGEHRLLQRR